MSGAWDNWIGRETQALEVLHGPFAARWLGTFDLARPDDSIMPQGIHLCLCTPDAATSELGEDGHPQRDEGDTSFFPPIPLPRRMWAASDIAFHRPLTVDAEIGRISTIRSITEKEGSTGKLGFVTVEHLTTANGESAVTETQTLVYRDAVAPDAPLSPPELGESVFDRDAWDHHESIVPDPRLLFRYSALTFNTHRIHYDLPYARDVERYRGLVVHGPLMASLLLQLAAKTLGDNALASFSFRAVSPAIAGEPLHLAMRQNEEGFEFGTFAKDGRQCVKANASLRPD